MNLPPLIFFTTNMRPTGSEFVLFNLLKELYKQTQKRSILIITEDKGSLVDQICTETTTLCFKDYKWNSILRHFAFIAPKTIENLHMNAFLDDISKQFKNHTWYINTVAQPRVLHFARSKSIPVIVHSHELQQILNLIPKKRKRELANYPRKIIACSNQAAIAIQELGRKNNISVSYPGFNISDLIHLPLPADSRSDIKQHLGIPKNSFVWVMVGTLDKNKNPLRFIEIAQAVLSKNPKAHFMWIGKVNDQKLYKMALNQAQKMGIDQNVHWLGPISHPDYFHYLDIADGFVLTSNKESFSLVVLESLALGKPVVSFNCGGVVEILTEETGKVLNSWNIHEMASLMLDVMSGHIKFDSDKAKTRAMDFNLENIFRKWINILEAV